MSCRSQGWIRTRVGAAGPTRLTAGPAPPIHGRGVKMNGAQPSLIRLRANISCHRDVPGRPVAAGPSRFDLFIGLRARRGVVGRSLTTCPERILAKDNCARHAVLASTDIDRRDWTTRGQRGPSKREFVFAAASGGHPRRLRQLAGAPQVRASTSFASRHGSARGRSSTASGGDLDDLLDRMRESTPEAPGAVPAQPTARQVGPPELLGRPVSPMPECTRPNWLESRGDSPWSQPLTYV
jgi:hypothetical protein